MAMAMAMATSCCSSSFFFFFFSASFLLVAFFLIRPSDAVRFILNKEECFTEHVEYDGDMVHVSFVVIRYEQSWNYQQHSGGVDLSVRTHMPSSYACLCILFLPSVIAGRAFAGSSSP
jgi:hypothetical protein